LQNYVLVPRGKIPAARRNGRFRHIEGFRIAYDRSIACFATEVALWKKADLSRRDRPLTRR
jgi:hypothetical protein